MAKSVSIIVSFQSRTTSGPRTGCIVVLLVMLLTVLVSGAPRSRSSKLKFQDTYLGLGHSATCKETEPCGWALYVPGSSPRRIFKYTRNIFCSCEGGKVCSLARDAIQQ